MKHPFLLLGLFAALVACNRQADDGPVTVSVVADTLPKIVDPDRHRLSSAEAVLLGATAQGLVRFDGTGQIEPGLAIRWDVSDDGIYYDFRTAEDSPIDAEQAARAFRATMRQSSRNPLKYLLGAVEEVVAVTPEVVEIRLGAPRPNMLQLLAQPEFALLGKKNEGTGPFRIARRTGHILLLTPVSSEEPEELDEEERERREVLLRGETTARAVARFEAGRTALVLGGTFADLGIARAAKLPANALRFDPVQGLFGLDIVSTKGFAGSTENRRALSMAIDRDAILRAFNVPGWHVTETLVPAPLVDLAAPARPDFIDTNLAIRRALGRDSVDSWIAQKNAAPHIRVAMPPGPGAELLFTLLRLDWRSIGIEAEAVPFDDEKADLRFVDEVAPIDGAAWYLRRFSCEQRPMCSEEADVQLAAARAAKTPAERARLLAAADARLAQITPFIPIATPVRWSLVSQRLGGFQENARGVHPLNHLRAPPR